MSDSLFIVKVKEDNEKYQYEYGCLEHAREHLSNEKSGVIYEYRNSDYYLVGAK